MEVYLYAQGGPHPSTAYIWRVKDPIDDVRDAAALAIMTLQARAASSRAMAKEFFTRFIVTEASKAAMRCIKRYLCPNTTSVERPTTQLLDERFLQFVIDREDGAPDLFFDLRNMTVK